MEVFSPEGPPKVWLHYHAVTVLVRHSQRKRGATPRLNLRSMAPVFDPTRGCKSRTGKKSSESILASSLAGDIARCRLKRRQRYRWAGLSSFGMSRKRKRKADVFSAR